MDLLLCFVVAMTVTMALIPPLMRFAGQAGIVDRPEARKVHSAPIPRVGGIAMAAGVLLALALWGHFDHRLQAFCAGVLVLLVFGVWDDRATLGASTKFVGQAIAVLVAMIWGGVSVASITVADRVPLPQWFASPLTFFFLIGATNAINLSDGLDGLAGGMTLLCLGALALMALTIGNPFVGPVALVTAGAILGFLRFNTHPARVFMGDCGSQILGFSVAVLSVVLTQDPQAPLSAALPLLLLGVPVMDTLTVMTERALAGRSPFKADRTHLHHRLLALGFHHHEAVMVIYLLQATLFVVAWFLRYHSDLTVVLAFAVFAAAVIAPLRVASARGWRWRTTGAEAAPPSALRRRFEWLRARGRLSRWAGRTTAVAVLGYGALVAIRMPPASQLTTLLALSAVIVAVNLVLRWKQPNANWIDKAALYFCAVLAVYLDGHAVRVGWLHAMKITLFTVLALAVLVRLRWSEDRQFTVNPLDLLVIFMAVAIPNLPGSVAGPEALGATAAKLVALLYGMEALSHQYAARWRHLSVAVVGFLAACLAGGT
jgi:UDP-GlcNAc:undecaprenyl-phosphate GlcNAc-1-phosphate transferase